MCAKLLSIEVFAEAPASKVTSKRILVWFMAVAVVLVGVGQMENEPSDHHKRTIQTKSSHERRPLASLLPSHIIPSSKPVDVVEYPD